MKTQMKDDHYDDNIADMVANSRRFGLTGDPAPIVVQTFYT